MPISIHITLLLLWKTTLYPKFLIYNRKQKPIQNPCNLCNSVLEINGHERKVKVIFQKSLKKKGKLYLPKSAIEIISHWQCKGVLFFKHQWKNVLFITNCEFKLSMLMHCMNKLVELCPWFFFLTEFHAWKK